MDIKREKLKTPNQPKSFFQSFKAFQDSSDDAWIMSTIVLNLPMTNCHQQSHCKPVKHCKPVQKKCVTVVPVDCGVVTTCVTQKIVCTPAPCQPKPCHNFGSYC
ncbi:hypothetical protein BC833DRAFT_654119 [Globomyces pollinis-pini]|nr:hypothetical protein BC833DRAFT_654119 [Globomyces pollinis-pini]